jgi:uncharacterized protein (TIGR02118 family)
MTWVIALHKQPGDPVAYERHYFDVHVPLALALPGLRHYEVSRGPVAFPGAEQEFLLVALMRFDSMAAVHAAAASPAGQAALDDTRVLKSYQGHIQLLCFESEVLLEGNTP